MVQSSTQSRLDPGQKLESRRDEFRQRERGGGTEKEEAEEEEV